MGRNKKISGLQNYVAWRKEIRALMSINQWRRFPEHSENNKITYSQTNKQI